MAVLQVVVVAVAGLLLAAIMVAVGARLRRLARLPLPPSLQWPVELCFGAGVLAFGILALGLCGALSPATAAGLPLLAAAGGRWSRSWRLPHAWAAALGGAISLPIAFAQPFFYDSLVYHLGLPWQALLEGGLRPHPESVFAAFPPLAQLLYTPPLALGLDSVPAVLHWIAFVAAGAALAGLARDFGASGPLASLAAVCFALLPSHALLPGLPAAEAWLLAPLAGAWALLLRRRVDRHWPLAAGVLLGLATAARLQALPWAAGAVVVAGWRSRQGWRAAVQAAAGCAAGALPWWLKNLILLGDPLAPLGWRREGLETLWRDGGSMLMLERHPGALLTRALAVAAPLAPWLVALALAALLTLVQRGGERRAWAAAAAVAGAVTWCLTASLGRFLAPASILVLALAAAPRRGAGRGAAAAALSAVAALGAVEAGAAVRRIAAWRAEAGVAFDARGPTVNDPFAAFAAAAALPGEARVLFIGEPRGFGFPRRFVAPSQHDVSPLRELVEGQSTPDESARRLRERGVTHLLLNRGELARLLPAYPVAPWRSDAGRAAFGELLQALGPPVIAAGGVEIYAIASGPPVSGLTAGEASPASP